MRTRGCEELADSSQALKMLRPSRGVWMRVSMFLVEHAVSGNYNAESTVDFKYLYPSQSAYSLKYNWPLNNTVWIAWAPFYVALFQWQLSCVRWAAGSPQRPRVQRPPGCINLHHLKRELEPPQIWAFAGGPGTKPLRIPPGVWSSGVCPLLCYYPIFH